MFYIYNFSKHTQIKTLQLQFKNYTPYKLFNFYIKISFLIYPIIKNPYQQLFIITILQCLF